MVVKSGCRAVQGDPTIYESWRLNTMLTTALHWAR